MSSDAIVEISYFCTPVSPWTYLGAARLIDLAARHRARIRIVPCDFGPIMAQSGGLPLGQRAKQRQAYRLQELARWRDFLGIEIVLQPAFFPVPPHLAAQAIIAVDEAGGDAAGFSHALGRAVWAEQRDVSQAATVADIATSCGLDGAAIVAAAPSLDAIYQRNTQEAITCGVFGAPTYLVGEEMFWGQDRLMFLDRLLQSSQ